jgi:ATP-dependent DNA ligase
MMPSYEGMPLEPAKAQLDLEGIVAKRKTGPYVSNREETTWIKV